MFRWVLVGGLFVLNILIFSVPVPHGLSVSFLDVGQGDAVLIEGPTGVQVLIDGGAGRDVLRELGSTLSFFDRTLDAVVATHPDQDHIGGLSDVLSRYKVGTFLESGVAADTPEAGALEDALTRDGVTRVVARRGMHFTLGAGAYADILLPDRDVSGVEANTGSVVIRVVYGDTSFMLSGDAPSSIERYLVLLSTPCATPQCATPRCCTLGADVLKAGHHGSKTSSDEGFVRAVAPTYVVFSRGCNNRYGHPSPEVVLLFRELNIPMYDTCENGTITFRSDGKTLTVSSAAVAGI
ncbi:MAG: ComEC/Rec2 family competence protein [Candidatus Paceibacteria bacterium]